MCEAAWAASHTKDTYLAAQFRRFARRFGKKGTNKAIIALAHTMLIIVFHVLADQVDYRELGPDFYRQLDDLDITRRRLIRQLQATGVKVTIEPAA